MNNPGKKIVVERTLTQADFDNFAALSGDDNPIHVDPVFSAESQFGRTVAHGFLINTILRGLLDTLVPGGRQLSQSLIFPAPTYADELMRFAVSISSDDGSVVKATMSSTRADGDVVTCEGFTEIQRESSRA